jgi:hypothetical protein
MGHLPPPSDDGDIMDPGLSDVDPGPSDRAVACLIHLPSDDGSDVDRDSSTVARVTFFLFYF